VSCINQLKSLKSIILDILRTRTPPKGKVYFGEFTEDSPHILSFHKEDNISFGKFCIFGSDVMLIVGERNIPSRGSMRRGVANYHLSKLSKKSKEKYNSQSSKSYITIGNDVWVGAGAIVLTNVSIGDGAIIGAGAVVTHDIPPYTIAAGVPARIIRLRFSPDQIEKLLKIAWWNWDRKKVASNIDLLRGDVEAFIDKFYRK
jgi:virginiamycin A acetyltransferase